MTRHLFCLRSVLDENHAPDDGDFGACGWALIVFSYILVALTFPVSLWMCIKVSFLHVPTNQRGFFCR